MNDNFEYGAESEEEEKLLRIHCEELGLCSCGDPETSLRFLRDVLALIDTPRPRDPAHKDIWKAWHKARKDEETRLFGSEGHRWFVYYVLADKDLVEHGGSVPGWLSATGKDLLARLDGLLGVESPDPYALPPAEVTVGTFEPKVGLRSLVALDPALPYPREWGNYCGVFGGPRLVNIWAENLEEWARRNPGCRVEVTTFHSGKYALGVVTDKRLSDWCSKTLCFTGMARPRAATIRAVCNLLDIPYQGYLCGCEKPEEQPLLRPTYNGGRIAFTRCMRCRKKHEPIRS